MKRATTGRARHGAFAVLGAAIALMVSACVPPAEPVDDGRVAFDSSAVMNLSIDRGTPEEPNVATLPFTATATGAWLTADNGLFYVNLDINDTALEVSAEASPIGLPLTVGLQADQTSPAVGFFDPATGEGGFSTSVDITIATLDLGAGPAEMPQPCVAETQFDVTGSIDLATGELNVGEAGFDLVPPAAEDCGGLGEAIQGMLNGPASVELIFDVGTP